MPDVAELLIEKTLLQPATKLRQGNVFTSGCDSVHKGLVSVQACTTGHMTRGSVSRVLCPGGLRPGDLRPGGVSVRQTSLGRDPPYGNKRVVCMLLECILVTYIETLFVSKVSSSKSDYNYNER